MYKFRISIRQLVNNSELIQFDLYQIEAKSEYEAVKLADDRFQREYPDEDIEAFEIFALR